MKIISVEAVQAQSSSQPSDWRGWLGQIAVAVRAEDGLRGYGMGGGGAAGIHVVETALRHLLVGADGRDVEGLWRAMYRATLAYGRKGLALMAISGVDLALWDLRAKREDSAVVELLGGALGTVPAYRTTGVDGMGEALDAGYRALKIGGLGAMPLPSQAEGVVELVARAREAAGPEVALMADVGMAWDDREAVLALTERLAPFGLDWLEEPLPADDLEGYAWLNRRSPVPIAGGEHEYTAAAFGELMQRGCHAVYQPDVCWCGGLTELVKIYRLARRHGARVCPHRGAEPWALHAIAALDPEPLAESGRPWMQWVGGASLAAGAARLEGGPGFGVDAGLERALTWGVGCEGSE